MFRLVLGFNSWYRVILLQGGGIRTALRTVLGNIFFVLFILHFLPALRQAFHSTRRLCTFRDAQTHAIDTVLVHVSFAPLSATGLSLNT